MRLQNNEHSILATFPSNSKARSAVNALQEAGIEQVQLDRISRFGVEANQEYNNPLAGQAETQTGLSLFSANSDRFSNNDSRVLSGSDPTVSGYGMHNYGVAGTDPFLVTVVTTGNKLNQALKIIKTYGGQV